MRLKKQAAVVAFHSQLSAVLEKLMVLAVEEIKELVFDLCEEISPEKTHNEDLYETREDQDESLYRSSDSFYIEPQDEHNEPQDQMSQTTSREDTKEKHGNLQNDIKFPNAFSNKAQETLSTSCKFEQAATFSTNPSSSQEEEDCSHDESRQTSFEPPGDSKNHLTDYSSADETQYTTYGDVSTNQEDHSRDVAFHVKQEEEAPDFETGNCTRFQMQTGQMVVQPTPQESFFVSHASYSTSYNLAFASLNIPRPMHSNPYVHKNWNNPSNGNTRTFPEPNKMLFRCEHCSKTYRFPSLLKAHYLKHTKEKQLACRFCGKPFKWEYSLRRHERMYCGQF